MYTEHEDGLFAKIDIPEKQIVSFFGGIIIDKETGDIDSDFLEKVEEIFDDRI